MARVPASRRLATTVFACTLVMTACSTTPEAAPSEAVIAFPTATAAPAVVPAETPAPTPLATPTPAPTPDPTPTPSPTPKPIVVKVPGKNEVYRFGPEMTAAERAQVKESVAYGVRLQEAMLGKRFMRFTILASRDLRWLAKEDCRTRPPSMPNCVAQQMESHSGGIMGGCYPAPEKVGCYIIAWLGVRGMEDLTHRSKVFVHEVHHIFQGQRDPDAWRATMVGPDRVWSTGPVWLQEGAAEWIGWRITFDRGLASYDANRAEWEEWARRTERSLDKLETRTAIDRTENSYLVSALAVDELVRMAPDGPRSLTAYYTAVARGTAWKTAFKQAFGMSVATFYKRFAAIRARLAG